jgi:GT2 family glycosyltransferase
MTDVDVIVLDIDGGAMLDACLDSIRKQSVHPARVIVFDNGSSTPARTRVGGVEVERSETNLGFAAGVNAAYRKTTASYVALVNNDVVLDRDWLATVRDALERDEKLAAAQTIIRRPDGKIDGAGISIADGTFRQIGHGKSVGTPLAVPWGVSATAAIYRRAALGQTVFDERFFSWYEDVDLCARLLAQGWRLTVLPVVKALHHGSRTAHLLGSDAKRLRTRNRYLVNRLHPGVGDRGALFREDLKLLLMGRSSMRGIWQGLFGVRRLAAAFEPIEQKAAASRRTPK